MSEVQQYMDENAIMKPITLYVNLNNKIKVVCNTPLPTWKTCSSKGFRNLLSSFFNYTMGTILPVWQLLGLNECECLKCSAQDLSSSEPLSG